MPAANIAGETRSGRGSPKGSSLVIFCLLVYLTPSGAIPPPAAAAALPSEEMLTSSKRNLLPSRDEAVFPEEEFPDYRSRRIRYDEFPILVPKRAALILDRILKEIESAKEGNQLINDWSPISRRGNNKDKLYFRCYFNAVSCYKRK